MNASCPVCLSASRFAYACDGYELYDCGACKHSFVSPVPSEEELKRIYSTDESSIANSDGWTMAEDYKANPQITHDYYRRSRLAWLEKVAGDTLRDKASHILDIGCSTGMFLRSLKDMGYARVHGFDISPVAAQFVQETHGIPCATSLDDLPNDSFDLITCYAVLEHVGDPVLFARTLGSKLKPGGKLAILVPNYDSYYSKLSGKSWVWMIPPIHLQYFVPRSLKACMSNAGLQISTLATDYSGTYLYLVVHHLMRLLKRPMPSTSRSRQGGSMALINAIEMTLKVFLSPVTALARMRGKANEIMVLAQRR